MNKIKITIYEHQKLKIGDRFSCGNVFTEEHLNHLISFFGSNGVPYYSLIHRGVKFNQYVGVLQLGNLTVEVLPKIDNKENSEEAWRKLLIDMIWKVNTFQTQAPTSSNLSLKSNAILDVYIAIYLQEIKRLLHQGLIKKYRIQEGNTLALKGSLLFAKHIQKNTVHQERFYTRHSVYDVDHVLHRILYKALALIKKINTNKVLDSEINQLLFTFPEMPNIKVFESTFEQIVMNRKTIVYSNALDIAKLLLLNYHPDVRGGNNNALALLFDMNILWERFIFVVLKKHLSGTHLVKEQNSRGFWNSNTSSGRNVTLRADITVQELAGEKLIYVLDTKWKDLGEKPYPSVEDLRQMYVYHQYYQACKTALIYPGIMDRITSGTYLNILVKEPSLVYTCTVLEITTKSDFKDWIKHIVSKVKEFTESSH